MADLPPELGAADTGMSCPHCNTRLVVFVVARGGEDGGEGPRVGDVAHCGRCRQPSIHDRAYAGAPMYLRAITEADPPEAQQVQALADAEVKALLKTTAETIRNRRNYPRTPYGE